MDRANRWRLPLAVFGLLVPAALTAAIPVRSNGQTPQTQPPTSPDTSAADDTSAVPTVPATNPELKAVTEAIRDSRYSQAAELLKKMKAKDLTPTDARRWRTLSAIVAMRLGDRAWLDSVTSSPSYAPTSDTLMTVTAARLLMDGRYDQARALLAAVQKPETLSEIPRRRYLESQAKLEQLTSNPVAERKYIDRLINFTGEWASDNCQACHANPRRYAEAVTTLDLSRVWYTDRYVALLKQQGDAAKVAEEAAKTLAKTPNDASAKLRLAYASRALGQEDKAKQLLQDLAWTDQPGRERKIPLRLGAFP